MMGRREMEDVRGSSAIHSGYKKRGGALYKNQLEFGQKGRGDCFKIILLLIK